MIVTCEACSTSFELDESRIPVSGARVRCSRCKHAFFLAHPSASAEEAVHAIAGDAAADDGVGTPAPASDLASDLASGPAAGSETDAARTPGPIGPDTELDEEEWEFNEEIRIAGDDDPEPGDDVGNDSDFGEAFEAGGLSLDVGEDGNIGLGSGGAAGESVEESGASAGPEPAAIGGEDPGRDESSFGTVDDFSSWMEDEEPGDAGLVSEGGSDPESPLGEADPAAGRYAGRGTSDDLGDPESWDLVGADGAAAPRKHGGGGATTFASPSASRGGHGATSELLDRFDASPEDLDSRAPSALGRLALQGLNAFGWAATLVLVAAVVFVSLRPEWTRWAEVPQVVESGSLRAESTTTGWLETARSGDLLVVRGRVINVGRETLWPEALRGVLLDGEGRRIPAPSEWAGMPLAEARLRESTPVELATALGGAVRRYLETPLAAGESRPFEIVIREVPPEARRVLLEIAEASRRPEAGASTPVAPAAVDGIGRTPAAPDAAQLDEEPFEPSP